MYEKKIKSVGLGLEVFCKKSYLLNRKKLILHDVEKLTQETSKMISDVTCDSWNRHNRHEQTYGLSYPMNLLDYWSFWLSLFSNYWKLN